MTEAAIFAVGSVMFVITTWATIAYGLTTVHELRLRDIDSSGDVSVEPAGQYTERYVRTSNDTPPPRQEEGPSS